MGTLRNYLLMIFLLSVFVISGCEDSVNDPPIDVNEARITGIVTLQDMTPVQGASVTASNPAQGSFTGVTNNEGRYSIIVQIDPQAQTTQYTITASKEGLGSEIKSLPVASGSEVHLDFMIGTETGRESGEGSNIVVVDVTDQSIGIKGSGYNETATITFEVRDAHGVPVDAQHQVAVEFSVVGGPGGGEFISPASAVTDGNGVVRATVNSGYNAGVVQILAQTTVSGSVVRSSPVLIVMHGGLASQAHFTVATDKYNFPGYDLAGEPLGVLAIVGDRNGNPVRPGTPVSFTTTGGTIQGSALTSEVGHASATLYSGNPRPNHPVYGPGFATITASTQGENGLKIEGSAVLLFSGRTVITRSQDLLVIDPGQESVLNFTVSDANGNPLTEGTTIRVTAEGEGASDVTLSGDIDVELPDTRNRDRWTTFTVRVKDRNPAESLNKVAQIVITVDSDNGNEKSTVPAILIGVDDIPPDFDDPEVDIFRVPHNILLAQVQRQSISVIGTGAPTSTTITFRVVDLLNRPIDDEHRVTVSFNLYGPGGGESLSISESQTNNQGTASTSLIAGTRSGVAQIVATVQIGERTIVAEPVRIVIHAGLPVQENFYFQRVQLINYPVTRDGMFVRMQVGDMYNNPVQPNTAVYFTAEKGMIQAEAYTDKDGFVTVTYWGRRDNPEFDTIYAETRGENGVLITKTTTVLVTLDHPVIVISPGTFGIAAGEQQTFNFSVLDINGHPLAMGQRIQVSLVMPPRDPLEPEYKAMLIGNTDITMPDTQNPADGEFWFAAMVESMDTRTFNMGIRIFTDGPNGRRIHEIMGVANP